jgi:hypothetical protein
VPAPPESAGATTGREGGGIAALDDKTRLAFEALLRITASEPRLTVGEAEALTLVPLVVAWLERTTERAMREALTAGLPAQVGSPVGLLRTRLLAKLPPGAAPAVKPGRPPWCGKCADDGLNTAARGNIKYRTLGENGTGEKCPRCHPDAMAIAA